MKAPRSSRSRMISRICWACFAAFVVANLISLAVDDTVRTWIRVAIGIPLGMAWPAALIALFVSRLSDGWDEESRVQREERRAQRASSSP